VYEGGSEIYTHQKADTPKKKLFIENTEFHLSLYPQTHLNLNTSGTSYKTLGPYKLIYRSSGIEGIHKKVIIEELRIESSLGKTYKTNIKSNMPLVIHYRKGDGQYSNRFYAEHLFDNLIDLDFTRREIITIEMRLTLETETTESTKTYSLKFYPYLDKGQKVVPF
jgi:hypothetical protein